MSLDSAIAELGELMKYLRPDELAEVDSVLASELPIWVPLPGPQTVAYESQADILYYGGSAGGGKALDITTPLPTPAGWMVMEDAAVGDVLFDDAGNPCTITAATEVMAGHPCYEITFSDGSRIIADAKHQWLTMTAVDRLAVLHRSPEWMLERRERRKSRATGKSLRPHVAACNSARVHQYLPVPEGIVRTTEEISRSIIVGKRLNHSIKVSSPLSLPDRILMIDPYVLGLWLGDGSSYKAEITTADPEVLEAVRSCGYEVKKRADLAYGINGGLFSQLKDLGLIPGNKNIPSDYLRGSIRQRQDLLCGLMDTDGTCDTSGQCTFTTTNPALQEGVLELIHSLGIKAVAREGRAKLYGKDCGRPAWDIKFLSDIPAFRLRRKRERQKRDGFRGTHNRRYIVSCAAVPSVPVRCIQVDSPSRLYLAGRQMIPTHNSDLLLGLGLTKHRSSIIYRREAVQLIGLETRLLDEILKSRAGWNGQKSILTLPDRRIEFGSCKNLGEEIKYQGRPHDFVGFDEIPHFAEQQFRFLSGWNRTTTKGQRCRVSCAGNPPTTEEGRWVVVYWSPWLDPQHPHPALPGELRWYVRFAGDDKDTEVDGPEHLKDKNGKMVQPRSRTFIPSFIGDNPFLMDTGYESVLQGMPEPLRSQMLLGDFRAGTEDSAWQVIPTAWVEAAQARWREEDGIGVAMDSVGADISRGGADKTCVSSRHGRWYAKIKTWPGSFVTDGVIAAGLILSCTRDRAPIHIDVIGVGSSAYDQLAQNNVHVVPVIAGENPEWLQGEFDKATGKIKFRNVRSWMYWRFRESLDPKTGDNIALPPDPELKADLCAPHWKITPGGILIESKDDSLDARGNIIPGLVKRLGRSPDKGDSVVMAGICTPKIYTTGQNFRSKIRKGSWRAT